MPRYGDIYRLPPAPQQRRPSAILPSEAFPDPPGGGRRRQIVMAIVAAQWIVTPPPQQRRPTVTEGAAVVEVSVPRSQVQDRVILESWRPSDRLLQRQRPTAILPAEVFDDPPLGSLKDRQHARIVAAQWRIDPPPQQRRPTLTEGGVPPVVVHTPRGRDYDRVIDEYWRALKLPAPQRRVPVVTAGTPVFVAPRIDATNARIVGMWWRPVHVAPQRSRPTAILPVEVFDDPPLGELRRQILKRLIFEQWRYLPLPYQRPPYVTESGVVAALIGPPRLDSIAMLETTLDTVAMIQTTLDTINAADF